MLQFGFCSGPYFPFVSFDAEDDFDVFALNSAMTMLCGILIGMNVFLYPGSQWGCTNQEDEHQRQQPA